LPPGSTVTNGDTSDSSDLNTPLADLEADMNIPRPVVAGGTGASSASAALVNFGLTATAAEINVLDGITATVTELNYTDGVTSAIQTQLDAKQVAGATLTSLEGLSLVAGDVIYATAADTLARLPVGTAGQALVVNTGATAPEWADTGKFTWMTPQATTSGTQFDFTGIPAGVTEIVVAFSAVSLSGTDSIRVQIGDSGGFETSGYSGAQVSSESSVISTATGGTAGFNVSLANSANAATGFLQLTRPFADNEWLSSANISRGAQYTWSAQSKTLSDVLTQVRVTVTGANTFDLGRVSVGYR